MVWERYESYGDRIRAAEQERIARDRARSEARLELEILRMVQAGHVTVSPDPYNDGCIIFSYPEVEDAYYDGSDVTEEVMDCHRYDFVRFGENHEPVLTDDGRAYLAAELDTDLGREYLADIEQPTAVG